MVQQLPQAWLTAWVAMINARPAVQRALAAVDDVRARTHSTRLMPKRWTSCSAAADAPRRRIRSGRPTPEKRT
jgi:hypothetical protein